jgi:hypothetical protein
MGESEAPIMTKREAELLEHIIRSLSEDEYHHLVFGWLPTGCNGTLWFHMNPRRKFHDDFADEKVE